MPLPYQKIMDAVLFGLAKPMFGAPAGTPTRGRLAAAAQVQHRHRQGQGAAGRGRLSERLRDHALVRPRLCRRQRAALRAGAGEPRRRSASRCTINKIPGANWRTELNKKVLPLYTNVFSGWLDYPEYFFFWCYHGKNSIFNTMSYQSPEMDGFIDGARHRGGERRQGDLRQGREGLRRSRLRRHAAHPAVPALRQRRDAEERLRLPVLVPPPARLPRACEGLSHEACRRVTIPGSSASLGQDARDAHSAMRCARESVANAHDHRQATADRAPDA